MHSLIVADKGSGFAFSVKWVSAQAISERVSGRDKSGRPFYPMTRGPAAIPHTMATDSGDLCRTRPCSGSRRGGRAKASFP
jgi:hypothetical protein